MIKYYISKVKHTQMFKNISVHYSVTGYIQTMLHIVIYLCIYDYFVWVCFWPLHEMLQANA